MATIPLWLIGKNVTSMTATVQSLNTSTGVLADSTGADAATLANGSSFIGLVDSIDLTATRVTENISSITQTKANNVKIARRDMLTVTEILRTGTTAGPVGTCLLANLWTSATSKYVKVAFTRGGNSWTFYGVMVDYTESLRRGKSTGTMSIQPIDIGATNTTSSNNALYS